MAALTLLVAPGSRAAFAQSCADPSLASLSSAELREGLSQLEGAISQVESAINEGSAFLAANPSEAEAFRAGFASTAGMSWEEALAWLADAKSAAQAVGSCVAEKEAAESGQARPDDCEPPVCLAPIPEVGPAREIEAPPRLPELGAQGDCFTWDSATLSDFIAEGQALRDARARAGDPNVPTYDRQLAWARDCLTYLRALGR